MKLHELKEERQRKKRMRVGRGIGSKGKTCGRGTKGDKARTGYKSRVGNEGGQHPVFRKIPIRGFTRGRHRKEVFAINLSMIEKYFDEGEVINLDSLRAKRFLSGKKAPRIKILGNGELTKAITFEVHEASKSAEEKITNAKGTLTRI